MLCQSNAGIKLAISLLVGLGLSSLLLVGLHFSQAAMPEPLASLAPGYTRELVPDQMTLTGDVTTRDNCAHPTVCSWLQDTPTGTIMLGVDPTSPDPITWDGGSATAEIFLEDLYSPTVLVLKLSWPDRDGKGLHSPQQNRVGTITLDGRLLWGKRTTHLSTFNDYYAAEHEPILMTIVLTQSITHTLTFSIPAQTAWDLSQIELSAYPYPTTIRGIGYSPYRDCQYPDGWVQPSVQELEEDLFRLFHTTNAIRTYSATGVNGQIPALANAIGLPIFAGAWIDYPTTTLAQDDDEIQALITLACTTDLEGVIVGNEYYLRHRTTDGINYLLQRIREVKNGIRECGKSLPVITAEIDNLMFIWKSDDAVVPEGINPVYRPILDELDFIMVHIYPFWNKLPINGAAAFTVKRYKAIQALIEREYPGQNKWVIIGEAGWPSAGRPQVAAVPSQENQRRYMLEFLYLAEQEGVEYMYFDAFDELWKIEEPGRVGQNWGYSYTDRTAKHNFYGVLLPSEQLFPFKAYLPYIARHSASYVSHLFSEVGLPDIFPSDLIQASSSPTFPVFTEWPMGPGHFVPSGWMGDIENIGLYECDRTNPHSGEMAIRASFSPTGTSSWGGIYWQYPENNWGTLEGGHNLTGASLLSFWVRGKQGGEIVEFLVGGLGEPTDPFPDTIRPARSTGPIVLSDTWQQVEISLTGADLSRVIGGFAWVASRCYNSEPVTFYIDDILFDFDPAPEPVPPSTRESFHVYGDDDPGCNHFIPSGWMGDISNISLNQAWADDPHSGETTIRASFSPTGTLGWSGIYWQEPENNWGDLPGGYDLTGARRLTFWMRGDQGGEVVEFLVGGLGDLYDPFPDTIQPARYSGPIVLSETWQQAQISLAGENLSRVIGGFAWVASRCYNSEPITFYIDDVLFDFDPTPEPILPPTRRSFYVYDDNNSGCNHFVPSGWMGDISNISLDQAWTTNPRRGTTAIRITYSGHTWAGVYWQEPENNWGNLLGGYDLTTADRLTFWARSDTPNTEITFLIGGIGYADGTDCWYHLEPYPDSVCPKIEQTETLFSTWTMYTIDLPQYRNLRKVIGGFGWVAQDEVTFYLDDIVYELD